MADNPPAWHPDPTGAHDHRWWDGQRWTEHVADAGVAAIDPLPAAPPATGGSGSAHDTDRDAGDPASAASATGGMWTSTGDQAGGGQTAQTGTQPAWPGTEAGGGQTTQPGSQPAWPGTEGGAWDAGGQAGWQGGQPPAAGGWGPATAPTGDPTKTSGMAVTALVLGLLAIPSAIILIGGLLGLVAIILGAVAAGKAKRGETGGRGVAIGGIITGSIGLLIAIGLFIAVFANIASDVTACIEETGDPERCQEELERDLLDRFG